MLEVKIHREKRDKYYSISFQYNEELVGKIKSLPKDKRDWDNENKCWRLPVVLLFNIINSYKGRKDIFFNFIPDGFRQVFIDDYKKTIDEYNRQKVFDDNETKLYYERKAEAKKILEDFDRNIEPVDISSLLKPDVKPFRHQVVGALFLKIINSGLLAMDMGVGKSLTALLACIINPQVKKVFIICPASLKLNWRNEIEKFTTEKAFIINYNKNIYPIEDCKYIITNYEYFKSKKFDLKKNILHYGIEKCDTIILDESHRVSNPQSNTSRNIRRIFKKTALRFYLLSGTPIKNKLPEIYPQLNLIAPYEFQDKNLFMNKYCGQEFNGLMWEQVKKADPDLMYEDLKGLMYRKKKSEVLDLPPMSFNKVQIELSKSERDEYELIKKEVKKFKDIDISSEFTAKPIIEIISKLRQFTSKVKVKYTIELVKQLNSDGQKVVIFDEFKAPIFELVNLLDKTVAYTGETPIQERQNIVDLFQEDNNKLLNFAGTIKAANVGITLTKASYAVMNGMSYVPPENEQSYARIHRISTTLPVTVYIMVCENTIDETVYNINVSKQKTISRAIDGEKYINTSEVTSLRELINSILI